MSTATGTSAKDVVTRALESAGSIDILVNAAGVCHFNRMKDVTAEEWDEVLEVALAARPTPQLTTPPATEKPARPARRGRKGNKQVQAH